MEHKTDTDSERASFEAWMCAQEGYPFAGAFANLMWKSWQARASLAASAGSEPVASIYITPAGEREMDDWKVDLPVGRNILYTHPSPPEGMVMVPREPTKEMLNAGRWLEYGESSCHMVEVPDGDVAGVWTAMIASAPPIAAGGGKDAGHG